MNQEIYKAVSDYHTATMGDDRQEIEDAEQEYELMKLVHGVEAVQEVMNYYNENVIRKARQMITLTFNTWEEFDDAIAGITSLEIELAKDK